MVFDGFNQHAGRDSAFDVGEEVDELFMPVLLQAAADHLAIEDVERCKQRGDAVALGLGDSTLGSHRIDGDEGAGEREALQQQRDGDDLVRLVAHRLLSEHEALPARPGGDEMQRLAARLAGMRAPRGLAVDGDDVGRALAQELPHGCNPREQERT